MGELEESPISKLENYRTKIFDMFPELVYLDNTTQDGECYLQEGEEDEEDEDGEDMDEFLSNDFEGEEFEDGEEFDEDEEDEEDEEEIHGQNGNTIGKRG